MPAPPGKVSLTKIFLGQVCIAEHPGWHPGAPGFPFGHRFLPTQVFLFLGLVWQMVHLASQVLRSLSASRDVETNNGEEKWGRHAPGLQGGCAYRTEGGVICHGLYQADQGCWEWLGVPAGGRFGHRGAKLLALIPTTQVSGFLDPTLAPPDTPL